MANVEQIEQELREYLNMEQNLRKEDRLSYLMSIVNKHFAIEKLDHMVDYREFDSVVSQAKQAWVNTSIPLYVSKKEIHNTETNYLLVMEAFLNYLNRNKLLRRLVKFDYTGR